MARLRAVRLWVVSFALAATAHAQNRAVDTDGAIDLAGAVVLPSKVAVLLLALAMVLLCVVGALLAQRTQERREAEKTRRRLEARLAAQEEELARLRGGRETRGDRDGHAESAKSRAAST